MQAHFGDAVDVGGGGGPGAVDSTGPPHGAQVKIAADDLVVFCDLGEEAAQITDGYGGWAEIARPGDVAITEWAGHTPLRMTLPLMLDGWAQQRGVEQELAKLLKLGRRKDGDEEPPAFRVTGPVPLSGQRWVMEGSPDFGVTLRRRGDGRLVRQHLTLQLMEYVKPDRLKLKKKRKGGSHTYKVRKGDTLRRIAKKLKPNLRPHEQAEYARKIGKLNNIRDIRRKLEVGLKLRLPGSDKKKGGGKDDNGKGGGGNK